MSENFGRTRGDVGAFPRDAAARQALEAYLDALPEDPEGFIPCFEGDGLDFSGADLSGLELLGACLDEAILDGVRLRNAELGRASLIAASMRGADLSGALLRKAQGRACDARNALLVDADLRTCEFEEADLRNSDLRGADLARAWLAGTDLRGADLRACDFGGPTSSTALLEARMADSRLDGATGHVSGPVDVGAESPHLLDGDDLQRWFADHGAPEVEVHN
ncbi:pentapeptide repeat-containing protein [Actinomadura violacea]|uniref:Pentapeptide repeat-containing protein n=1 Tax=Actinomadura violacea TaxID=2819934 RepID=A0ABS3S891_9ACTN|nr:pentapeptide repeat-containing protein [Actinomadura violacea]MBO2465229.1 pentapeptide repeat-containing protein [Actinomadura violacea]